MFCGAPNKPCATKTFQWCIMSCAPQISVAHAHTRAPQIYGGSRLPNNRVTLLWRIFLDTPQKYGGPRFPTWLAEILVAHPDRCATKHDYICGTDIMVRNKIYMWARLIFAYYAFYGAWLSTYLGGKSPLPPIFFFFFLLHLASMCSSSLPSHFAHTSLHCW